jgi:hypothetical protein
LKTISIAKPSAQTIHVDRIFETSDAFNHQQLIVTFIKPNAIIPLSDLEGAQHTQINLRTFQLIVDLFLNPDEGAYAVLITSSSVSDEWDQCANETCCQVDAKGENNCKQL